MPVDFQYFLNRKYSQLQQQADATTQNAATNALGTAAAARLDNTRANLLPKESRVGIAKTRAETGLIGEQAAVIAPESVARIGQIGAETDLTRTQNRVAIRQGETPIGSLLGPTALSSLQGILGGGFQTSVIVPQRRPVDPGGSRRMTAEELDRFNGL